MAVGLAVLKELLEKNMVTHCSLMGELIKKRLSELSKQYEIENIRGKGLLIAFDLMQTKGNDLVSKCLKDGVLINAPKEDSIRLMPPLVVMENDVEKLMTVLKNNLKKKKMQ